MSTLTENAPNLIPVNANTEPTTVSILKIFLPPFEYYTFATNFDRIYHISKSKLRPCMTFPYVFLIKIPVQALNVEN